MMEAHHPRNCSSSLKELLEQTQHPFHLKTYIAEKRSQFRASSQMKALTNPAINPSKDASFTFSFNTSPVQARKSPFLGFASPLKSPLKPSATFLHIPARTAALLLEAAMRIQKQQQSSKHKTLFRSPGFGRRLFGSFLKRLRHNSKRAIGRKEIRVPGGEDGERGNISCSCIVSVGGADQSQAVTRTCRYDFSDSMIPEETQFCSSPFRFALLVSPSSSGSEAPGFCSPAGSPRLPVKEEIDECDSQDVRKVKAEDEEEKEQCSPVSILDDPFVEEEEDGHESEDDQDLERSSYANVQRKKQQLLHRLRRLEKLAELDPIELDRRMVECSDAEEDFDEALLSEVLACLNYHYYKKVVPTDMRKLVSDLIVEEILSSGEGFILARICSRLEAWKGVEFDTIDTMIDVDFKKDFGAWKWFPKQVEEATVEIELEILEGLAEELVIS